MGTSEINVSTDDLRGLIDTDLSEDALEIAIRAASGVVSDELHDVPVSSDRRNDITLFLAGHFAVADPPEKEVTLGDYRTTFERDDTGTGLAETRYGRRAIDLDPTNRLKKRNEPEPEFESFGVMSGSSTRERRNRR